jgi:secondary thiamine-phosphate synthase enzyme
MIRLDVPTRERCVLVDVTARVNEAVAGLDLDGGAVLVHVPHTTAAVTVNEGFDPDVAGDLLRRLEALAPHGADTAGGRDRHAEGNSDSHLKAAFLGSSIVLPVGAGALLLGRWQRVFLCEFDGPRTRQLWVSALCSHA